LALEENASARTYTYIWTFSEGQSATGPEVAAIFPVAGMYLASVIVTNDLGPIAVAQIAFQVVHAECRQH
jgi:PKD domain